MGQLTNSDLQYISTCTRVPLIVILRDHTSSSLPFLRSMWDKTISINLAILYTGSLIHFCPQTGTAAIRILLNLAHWGKVFLCPIHRGVAHSFSLPYIFWRTLWVFSTFRLILLFTCTPMTPCDDIFLTATGLFSSIASCGAPALQDRLPSQLIC